MKVDLESVRAGLPIRRREKGINKNFYICAQTSSWIVSRVNREKTRIVENSMEEEDIQSFFLKSGGEVVSLALNLIRRLDARETLGLHESMEVVCTEVVFNWIR